MNLLSPQDLESINAAFLDLRDTFLQKTITYCFVGETSDRFMENSANSFVQNIELNVLLVPESVGNGSQVEIAQKGRADFTEGYVLVYYPDLVSVSLADADNVFMQPDKDYMLIDEQKVEVIGINPIPDLGTLKSFVKIQYRKKIVND